MDERLEGIPPILHAVDSVLADVQARAGPDEAEQIATLEELRRLLLDEQAAGAQ